MPGKTKSKVTNGATVAERPPAVVVKVKSLDDFLESWSEDDDNEAHPIDLQKSKGCDNSDGLCEEHSNDSEEDESSEEDEEMRVKNQKDYLSQLSKSDPEFYEFLKEQDQELLNFDDDESSDGNSDVEDTVHKPPEKLEVASDESDFESEDEESASTVTSKMIEQWTEKLKDAPSISIIAKVVQAFRSTVGTIAGADDEDESSAKKNRKNKRSVVEGGAKFNAVTRMCLGHLVEAFGKVLKRSPSSKSDLQKSKMWPKLNKYIKMYSADLIKLVGSISSLSVLSALLKHVHTMVPYLAPLPKASKALLKILIQTWSSHKEESARVLAFMSILRLTRCTMKYGLDDTSVHCSLLEPVLKQLYMAYVRNVKFTSPTTWPTINFMRRSLAEIFNLDPYVGYRYAFIYIRQLAIQLRNAMIQGTSSSSSSSSGKKSARGKDAFQAVYNWQFVHSIYLWTQLLCDSHPSPVLEPLIYPLIQVITGTITLVYTPTFYPLRFLLSKLLTLISSSTGKFVPVLPYYLDILKSHNFGKKTTKVSMKPMDLSCVLRLSKSQLAENGFKDAVLDQVYEGLLEHLHSISYKISFPEISVPATVQLRAFVKKCPVSNYCKKIRQILDKTNENAQVVIEKRREIKDFGVADLDKIRLWEAALRGDGTPLSTFYTSWKSVSLKQTMKKISGQKKLDDYDFIPRLKAKKADKEHTEFKGLLGDDDDDDDDNDEAEDDIERFKLKEERGKKRPQESESSDLEDVEEEAPKKKHKVREVKNPESKKPAEDESSECDEDFDDVVKDFDMDDYASDEEGEDDDDDSEGEEAEEADFDLSDE